MRRLGWSPVDAVGIQVDPQVPAWVAPESILPAPVLAQRPHGLHRAPTTLRAQGSQGESQVCPEPLAATQSSLS